MHFIRQTFLSLPVLLSSLCCAAKDAGPQLAAASIPDSLKNGAHAVIRYDSVDIEVNASGTVAYRHRYAVTVLDEAGKAQGNLSETYNNLMKIADIRGACYDAQGNLIRRIKNKDIDDRSLFGITYTFNSDERIKRYTCISPAYPYTVVYEIDKTLHTLFFLPEWQPQPAASCAVAQAVLTLSYPESVSIRDKAYHMPAGAEEASRREDAEVYKSWRLRGIKAFEEQPLSEEGNYEMPAVVLAPTDFSLMGYQGSMDSWKSFGLFNYRLNQGRDSLPAETRDRVHRLVANDTSLIQKVQSLYSYMQQNTRYVADEYGIAGWQTFDAREVATKGYGDCKGLTNYLKSLLKAAGIPAYTVLASAGDDDFRKMDHAFPANTFNHAILCVPGQQDTIWVECTSQQLPAGYLGAFTQDRDVLLTTETGGYVVHTPAYGKTKSFIVRKAVLAYDNGAEKQHIHLHNYYSGLMQDQLQYTLKTDPEDKIRKMINAKFAFPSYHIDQYHYRFTGTQRLPAIDEDADAEVAGLVNRTAKRTFINLGWMPNPMQKIVQDGPRTLPLVLRRSFRVTDSVMLMLPEGMELESLPDNKQLRFPFAVYSCQIHTEGKTICLVRTYEQNAGTFGRESFDDYQKLYRTLNSDKANLTIVLHVPQPAAGAAATN